MRLALAIIAFVLATPAMAQPTAQPFVPYTIGEQEHQAIMSALGEIPAKYVLPIMQGIAQLEQRALQQANEARKKTEEKPPAN